ncbi:hypothetical protein [Paludibacterium denitrificans]|uniref:hypothetical protein n=1 Tax=Paludibacterium denitrificans TaxID=2675226 RepID=UPI001E2CE157|nr:hypothetical protein [Paludibacterium denitrificans]
MQKTRLILGLVVLAVVGGIGYGMWQSRDRGLPEGLIQANGLGWKATACWWRPSIPAVWRKCACMKAMPSNRAKWWRV